MPDMEQLYAWTEIEDGYEAIIVTTFPGRSIVRGSRDMPLQHNRLDACERFREIALDHGRKTGHRVRLVRFDRARVVEEHNPGEES